MAIDNNNILPKKDKPALYRTMINARLMDELKDQIVQKILVEKKYRDMNYSAKKLAEELNTNTRYISAVINVKFNTNYTTLINRYRIEEAMSYLRDHRYDGLTIENISDMVGFSNRQSFYTAFARENGITPREFRIKYTVGVKTNTKTKPSTKK